MGQDENIPLLAEYFLTFTSNFHLLFLKANPLYWKSCRKTQQCVKKKAMRPNLWMATVTTVKFPFVTGVERLVTYITPKLTFNRLLRKRN